MLIWLQPKIVKFNRGMNLFFIILLLLSISICVCTYAIAEKPDVNLKIQKITVPKPVTEDEHIIIGVLIKNTGTDPTEHKIENKLYIDSGNNLVSNNNITDPLSAGASIFLNVSWIAELGDHTLIIKLFYNDVRVDRQDVPISVNEKKIDLTLNGVYISKHLRLNQPVVISANTTNTGRNTTNIIKASLLIDGKHEQSETIEGLMRDKTYNFSFEWIPNHFDYHTINITLDPENKIKEEDENNNFFEIDKFIEPYRIEWTSTSWHYRKLYATNSTGNISLNINFTKIMKDDLGIDGKTFENDSIMIVQYLSTGDASSIVNEFDFQESVHYNNKTNAKGTLLWKVSKKHSYYCIYFDVVENNNSRKKIDQLDGMTKIGNVSITFEKSAEGWWSEFVTPAYNYYPLYIESSIKIHSVAVASTVKAELYWKGIYQKTITLDSTDNINWNKKDQFTKKGTWFINIISEDVAGFQSNNTQTENFSVLAVPDLAIKKIILPTETILEGKQAPINVIINNSGYAKAVNYSIGLYLAQDRIRWNDDEVKNTTNISITTDESKEISITWNPTLYGSSGRDGKWIVGVWIYTNSLHKDSNIENNRKTNHSIKIIPGEKNKPKIILTELTHRQEAGKSVQIIAEIIDESGIKNVNLTIINPYNKKYYKQNNQQTDDTYIFQFQNTSIIGKYNFSITAIDNSFYQSQSKIEGTFEIIGDETPPIITYFGAYPPVQIKNGYVNISCISTDFDAVKEVTIVITYPDNLTVKRSMKQTTPEGKYEYSQVYEMIGKYIFYIISEDTSGNLKKTEQKVFWITTNIDDIDNDGMPNSWEKRYGFDPYDPRDSKHDDDGDGYTNIEEYKSGYNPLKQLSSLQEIVYKFRDNWSYLILSIILCIVILGIALYGLKRQKNESN
jgi:hypothetical protein